LPTNYKCVIEGNQINGHIVEKKKKTQKNRSTADEKTTPFFTLKFHGLNSRNDGFLECQGSNRQENPRKRATYNLVTNNAMESPTIEVTFPFFFSFLVFLFCLFVCLFVSFFLSQLIGPSK
jgi:hypothetical protein